MLLRQNLPITERPLVLSELPLPEPARGEILVRTSVCGICRTDLHVIEGELPRLKLPLVPGHQIIGRVERLGDGCTRFGRGERVGIAWLRHTCGRCDDCRRGRENLCLSSLYTGYHADGGYAEYATVREEFAYAIPAAFDDPHAAPLLCAGIIGYRALGRSELPAGGRLGLYGFGSSAHVVLEIALHRGARVYVATRGAEHQTRARRMGAHWVGGADDPPPDKLDSAIVFAPAGAVVAQALRAVGRGGTVVAAGIYMTPIPELDYETQLFHEKNLRSVEAATRADGEALLRDAAAIPLLPTVAEFPLAEANEALIALKNDRISGSAVLIC